MLEKIKEICKGYDAYLVGGAAVLQYKGDISEPKDYDVIIQGDKFPVILGLYKLNKFGGRKYEYLKLDIWLDNVADFLLHVPHKELCVAININTGVVIGTQEFFEHQVGSTGRQRYPL